MVQQQRKIYALECVVNGFAYVGYSGAKLGKRLREHRCMLNTKIHSSKKMILDWHKYGEAKFKIKVLEVLPDAYDIPVIREAELRWQREYDKVGKLYNVAMVSFTLPRWGVLKGIEAARKSVGNRWTPEANLARSKSQLGIPKGHGAKISATKRKNKLLRLKALEMR